jgi:hypothetical protein
MMRYTSFECALDEDAQKYLEYETGRRALADSNDSGTVMFANLVRHAPTGEWTLEVIADNERFPLI